MARIHRTPFHAWQEIGEGRLYRWQSGSALTRGQRLRNNRLLHLAEHFNEPAQPLVYGDVRLATGQAMRTLAIMRLEKYLDSPVGCSARAKKTW